MAIAAAAIMVDRPLSAWKKHNITGILLMDIKAAFTRVARRRLIHAMKSKRIDGDLIQLTESLLSEKTVEMVTESDVLQSHRAEAASTQDSPVSPILFAIHTAGLIKWVDERVQAEGLSCLDNQGLHESRQSRSAVGLSPVRSNGKVRLDRTTDWQPWTAWAWSGLIHLRI
jgi:hypothetical protein